MWTHHGTKQHATHVEEGLAAHLTSFLFRLWYWPTMVRKYFDSMQQHLPVHAHQCTNPLVCTSGGSLTSSSTAVLLRHQFSFWVQFVLTFWVYPWNSWDPWPSHIFWFLEGEHEFPVQEQDPYLWQIHSTVYMDWLEDPCDLWCMLRPKHKASDHVQALSEDYQLSWTMNLAIYP